jgi:uncharacterized protein YdeI (BOF family)
MPSIAIIDRQTGAIATFYEDEAPNQGKFGGPWGWPESTVHVEVPSDMDKDVIRAMKTGEDTYIFEDDPDKVNAKVEQQWHSLRAERNRRLVETDWTMTLDAPLDDAQKATVREYRNQLRALPSSVVQPKGVSWPVNPLM